MLIRVFNVTVRAGMEDAWEKLKLDSSIPWFHNQKGVVEIFAGKPVAPGSREFAMVSFWDDLSSLREAVTDTVGKGWTEPMLLENEWPYVEKVRVDHYQAFGPQKRWK